MAKRQLIWSQIATIKLFEILDYYIGRNGSKTYSKKLYKKIIREASALIKQPEMGVKTDSENIRGLIIGNYILFFEVTETNIIVYTVWDSRQDPENLKIK